VNWAIKSQDMILNTTHIYDQWLNTVNRASTRDHLLTDKIKFGPLVLKKQLVLNTWSGLLLDEDSLPDDWTYERALVGMRPINNRNGIG
jgi:hypothetical protein